MLSDPERAKCKESNKVYLSFFFKPVPALPLATVRSPHIQPCITHAAHASAFNVGSIILLCQPCRGVAQSLLMLVTRGAISGSSCGKFLYASKHSADLMARQLV